MKRKYIEPVVEVLELDARDGFLAVTSDVGTMPEFDKDIDGGEGDGGDYGRENNKFSGVNIWEQDW